MIDEQRDISIPLAELVAFSKEQRKRFLATTEDAVALLRNTIDELAAMTLTDLTVALTWIDSIIALADESELLFARIEARTAASNALAYANRFDQAIDVLDDARTIAASDGDRSLRARIEMAYVQPYARLGRFNDAIQCAQTAVDLYESLGEIVMAGKSHSNLGVIHRMKGDAEASLTHFDKALDSLGSEPIAAAQLESNRATALLDLARFKDAASAFRRSLSAFDQTPHRRARAIVEGNLADLMGREGRLQSAIRHFERAQRSLEDDQALGDAARLGAERAEVLLSVGLLEDAIAGFERSIEILDEQGMASEAARARTGLGAALARSGQLSSAESMLRRSATGFAAIGARNGVVNAHLALSRVLLVQGRVDEAGTLLDDISCEDRDGAHSVAIGAMRAACLIERGDAAAAIEVIDTTLNDASDHALPLVRADLLDLRGRASQMAGDTTTAQHDFETAIAEIERVRGSLHADRLRTAWLGDRLAPYHALLALALDQQDAARVFDVLEMIKSRALLDVMQGGIELAEQVIGTSDQTDPEEARLIAELTDVRTELNLTFDRLYTAGLASTGRPLSRDQLSRRAQQLERTAAALEGRLAATRRFGELFARPIDARAAADLVDETTVLIEFFITDDQVGAVTLRGEQLVLHPNLIAEHTCRETADRIAFQVDRGLSGAARSGARAARLVTHAERELGTLYQQLIAPLESVLKGAERIVVIPHGPLFGVPIHAAFDGSQFLIERYTVSYAPSASLLSWLRGAQVTQGSQLIIGVADQAAPHIESEVEAIAARLPGARLLTGAHASAAALTELAPQASLLHLATHGIFPADDPLDARLRLADRWISVRDIYGMKLSGCAVTLSACDAGRAAVLAGDELFGLIRAFLAAGASSIVTSLWAVHDESTRELMDLMYDTTRVGPRAERLADAQRTLLKERRHPAFWAPFFCIGGGT